MKQALMKQSGYFTLNDLSPGNRAAASDVLGQERVTGQGCG
jgi:hypothetical protein